MSPPREGPDVSWRRWLIGLGAAVLLTYPAWREWTDPHLNLLWEEVKGVDDAKNHMLRLYLLVWMSQHGVWLPRWLPDLFMGYGYPLFNYYAPGFYYVALALRGLLRLDVWDGYKAVGPLAAMVGAAGAYALTVDVWRHVGAGVVAAVALLYGPYVFQTNLFQRGDLPEALALGLLAWLLLCVWRLVGARRGRETAAWLAAAALVGSGIVLIHNITALLAAGVTGLWSLGALGHRRRWRSGWRALAAGVGVAGLTAFFWLPAMAERGAVQLEILLEGHLDYREWLLDPAGAAPRQRSPENRQTPEGLIDTHPVYPHQHQFIVTLKPGLGQVALGVLAAGAVALGVSRRSGRARLPLAPLLGVAIGSWLLTFRFAEWAWASVPGLALLQYPSRLLGPAGVCVAVAGAGGLALLAGWIERRWGVVAAWSVVGISALALVAHGAPGREVPWSDDPRRPVGGQIDGHTVWIEEGDKFGGTGTTSGGEFTPRSVEIAVYTAGQRRGRPVFERLYPEADWVGGLFQPLEGSLRFLTWEELPLRVTARVANDGPGDARLGYRQFVFPGWRAWVDGRPAEIERAPWVEEQQASLGFITVAVPPGEHTVTIAFGPTAVRVAGALISLATVAAVAMGLWWLARPGGAWRLAAPAVVGLVVLVASYLTWRGVRPMFHRFAVVQGGQGRLLANLAHEARTGQARISSPSGAALGPDRFVDVRQLLLVDPDRDRGVAGRSRREWLYTHPPTEVSGEVDVPTGPRVWLTAAAALDEAVWRVDAGDGVAFVVTAQPLTSVGGGPIEVLREVVNPRANAAQRRFVPLEADLTALAGQRVRLTLRTEPRDDLTMDWAGWANPVVVSRATARIRPLQHVIAAPR
ncbi:MAG TPA: 6-pyruvoyl-tetrahydropterin synthase-related protein [Chloroflexota bacterium]|nr:6-pyruvoyl-tetrahydropterin synthase-related protein [Chloroflexota bacterium]